MRRCLSSVQKSRPILSILWAPLSLAVVSFAFVAAGCSPQEASAPPAVYPSQPAGYPSEQPADREVRSQQPGYAQPPPPLEPVPPAGDEPATAEEAAQRLAEDEQRLSSLLGPDGELVELSVDKCGVACSALASLRRSADALCRLAGEDDDRCQHARGVLSRGEQRVQAAGCSCEEG